MTSYDAVIVPLIFIIFFWLKGALACLDLAWQRGIKAVLLVWAMTALTTGYLFTYYPNALNLSGYDWSGENKFYEQAFDFGQDAAMIDALTLPQAPVALISSFETKILMQANRRPYFYYFPMVESEHMQAAQLRGIYLHTHARLMRTVMQLQNQAPAYIFIQTRLIEGPQAEAYEQANEGFRELMAYIRQHYEYQQRGQYLTAVRLK